VTKVGLLIPSANTVAEGEFHAGTPAEVSIHTARMKRAGTSDEDVSGMVADAPPRGELVGIGASVAG
jgi:maleate cis-trans isomerase